MIRKISKFATVLSVALLLASAIAQTGEGELPPLPPPTEAQLQRGRELLDKILYVIDNVPLTDAAAVLEAFGFTELITREHPTYTYVQPRASNGRQMLPADMVGTGLKRIQADPMRTPSQYSAVVASFEGGFALDESCVHIDEVRQRFSARASEISSSRMTYIHPNPRPPRQHDTGRLVLSLRENPFAERTGIRFTFEYQSCAKSFSFSYSRPEGAQK